MQLLGHIIEVSDNTNISSFPDKDLANKNFEEVIKTLTEPHADAAITQDVQADLEQEYTDSGMGMGM